MSQLSQAQYLAAATFKGMVKIFEIESFEMSQAELAVPPVTVNLFTAYPQSKKDTSIVNVSQVTQVSQCVKHKTLTLLE